MNTTTHIVDDLIIVMEDGIEIGSALRGHGPHAPAAVSVIAALAAAVEQGLHQYPAATTSEAALSAQRPEWEVKAEALEEFAALDLPAAVEARRTLHGYAAHLRKQANP